ncbi:sigma-70 family RNA polymerase sigma factor [Candidatus Parcubacteria bacterium]|nr:MAG: sigma-70 family RNA polymerase sigma factor [Candidatus Parcubacteria bacterium]
MSVGVPNMAEPLTPEDQKLVERALQAGQPMQKAVRKSPFEGKSLSKGLRKWKNFLMYASKAVDTLVENQDIIYPPAQDEIVGSKKPEQQSSKVSGISGSKPARKTQIANNIAFEIPKGDDPDSGTPGEKEGISHLPISRSISTKPRSIPKPEEPISPKERLAREQETLNKNKRSGEADAANAKKTKEAKEIAEFGTNGPFDKSNVDQWPSIDKMLKIWGPLILNRAKRMLAGNKGAEQTAEDMVSYAIWKHIKFRGDVKLGYKTDDDGNPELDKSGNKIPVEVPRGRYDSLEAFRNSFLNHIFSRTIDKGRSMTADPETKGRSMFSKEGKYISEVNKLDISPEQLLSRKETQDQLRSIIDSLPEIEKTVLMLHHFGNPNDLSGAEELGSGVSKREKGMKLEDIANSLSVKLGREIPVNTVKTWLRKARQTLEEKISDELLEDVKSPTWREGRSLPE